MSNSGRKLNTTTFFGLLLILGGVLWALQNTGVIDLYIRVWWPLILIVIGLLHLFHHRRVFDFFGWLMMGLGIIFLLTENDFISRREIRAYWPLLLVVLGFSIIFNRGRCIPRSSRRYSCQMKLQGQGFPGDEKDEKKEPQTQSDDRIDESTIFGSITKKITSRSFKGGSIAAVFGGAEIDLRSAELSEDGAVLDISAIFGGVELRIPESWVVQTRSSAVLGGVDSKYSNTENNTGKRLVIDASAIFGGIDIRN